MLAPKKEQMSWVKVNEIVAPEVVMVHLIIEFIAPFQHKKLRKRDDCTR